MKDAFKVLIRFLYDTDTTWIRREGLNFIVDKMEFSRYLQSSRFSHTGKSIQMLEKMHLIKDFTWDVMYFYFTLVPPPWLKEALLHKEERDEYLAVRERLAR